jgi:hypothetical protein
MADPIGLPEMWNARQMGVATEHPSFSQKTTTALPTMRQTLAVIYDPQSTTAFAL